MGLVVAWKVDWICGRNGVNVVENEGERFVFFNIFFMCGFFFHLFRPFELYNKFISALLLIYRITYLSITEYVFTFIFADYMR